ncbi:MAG: S8 family peptidase [Pikeienuella sp.]
MKAYRVTAALAALGLALSTAVDRQAHAQTIDLDLGTALELVSPTIASEFVVQIEQGLEIGVGGPALEGLGGQVISGGRGGSSVAVIRQPGFESMGLESAIARLESIPGVRSVEPNFEIRRMKMPNDPMTGDMWMIEAIELAEAWGVLDDAGPVVVAVIDDGVQIAHEDLAGNLWTNPGETPGNGVDDDGNGFIDDVHGYDFGENDGDPTPDPACWNGGDGAAHGTHVAGTVGAVGNNGVGVVGAAPKVQIMSLKLSEILDKGCRYAANGSIVAAIDYATRMGANVISMSLGGPRRSAIQRQLIERAIARDIVVVAAAGNDGLDIDGDKPHIAVLAKVIKGKLTPVHMGAAPTYPAAWNLDGQITVAATERPRGQGAEFVAQWQNGLYWTHMITGLRYTSTGDFDNRNAKVIALPKNSKAIGSNYGATRVHVAAPGKGILSTVPKPQGNRLNSSYASFNGTSMATPAVSGAVAILRAAFPEMTAQQIKRRVMTTVDTSVSLRSRTVAGGEINLFAMLCGPGAPRRLAGCDGGDAAGGQPTVRVPTLQPTAPPPAQAPRQDPVRVETPPAQVPATPQRGAVNINDLLGN